MAGVGQNTPSSPAEPELQQPAGGAPVTNTGASIDVDPLATVENRNQVREHPDEVTIIPGRETKLITGFSAAVRTSPSGEAFSTVEVAENATENRARPSGRLLPRHLSRSEGRIEKAGRLGLQGRARKHGRRRRARWHRWLRSSDATPARRIEGRPRTSAENLQGRRFLAKDKKNGEIPAMDSHSPSTKGRAS